ncbi:MAG: CocE/NonD family hydrolase [Paenibacillaceae bacterium]|nr:CocE/NonD family hydrolase [Paenibacillaceae bacterium]
MNTAMVVMGDGIRLATDIYLPQRVGPFPVVLNRTPYGKAAIGQWAIELLLAEGYALCVQDTRGRYESEGAFDPFANEAADGADTLAWLKAQPWCNGRIGGYGMSYHGYTQYAMALDSDDVCALTPVFGSLALDRVLFRGGVFCLSFLQWALVSHGRTVRDGTGFELARIARHRPAIEAADVALGERVEFYRDWRSRPLGDAYWDRLTGGRNGLERIGAPALVVAGWYDMFAVAQLGDFERLQRHPNGAVRRGSKLLVGPWNHTFYGPHHAAYGIEADVAEGGRPRELLREMMRWLAFALHGADNGWAERAPVRLFVMGENVWRDEAEWPLARAECAAFYLHSGGKANTAGGDGTLDRSRPDGEERPDAFVYDPCVPVPAAGGSHIGSGPAEQAAVERREDVLVYTSAPLAQPLEITGPIALTLFVATDAPDTDFTGKLTDVFPDGRSFVLSDGIARVRHGADSAGAKPPLPGDTIALDIAMSPVSVLLREGHRIRLQVSSSNFPCYATNPNTGADDDCATETRRAMQRVYHDSVRASYVTLPVVPRTAVAIRTHA